MAYFAAVRSKLLAVAGIAIGAGVSVTPAQSPKSADLDALLAKASAYVSNYEQAFSLLVSEEHYVQEIRRPVNPGTNLSRTNPGGGMLAGGVTQRTVLRSDYLLVQLGPGAGWMPFRDVFQVNASKVRDREGRLAKLFLSQDANRFELAARIMEESTRHNLGNVSRTINIPTLGLMFLHPDVRERFAFEADGTETLNGLLVKRVSYHEVTRPTLIKTTRGRDLPLDGLLWIDPSSGVVVKTELNAADPAVRAQITVTFQRDSEQGIWVPAQMDEYYKAANSIDEILATATYTNVRRFTVKTSEALKPPPR